MRFSTLTAATTTAIAIAQAAPIAQQTYESNEVSVGFLDSLVNSIASLIDSNDADESEDKPVETPGEHWKNVGKDQKKHWKKIGKGYKKKYTPPTESDDEDAEYFELVADEDEPVETPGEHWKKFGKDQKKYWKKIGKEYKKKYTPPAESDDEVELMEVSNDEPVETPGEHWKKFGKDQKKYWKNIGKEYKKKYTPPAESDDEVVELMEVSDDEPVETPGEHWKKFGKDQKKHWKKIGKEYKKKYTPPAESDDEVEFDADALL